MIPVTHAKASSKVRYMLEVGNPPRDFVASTATLTKRSWDVSDAEERERIAAECFGDLDSWYDQHAGWWICPEQNEAALLLYRPKTDASPGEITPDN